MTRELTIPTDAANATQAVEVFRGWIIDGGLQCSLFPTVWAETPEVWGILLADAARHVANAIAEDTGMESATVFATIRTALENELRDPSDEHAGQFTERNGEQNGCRQRLEGYLTCQQRLSLAIA